jgi:hypothetical protein
MNAFVSALRGDLIENTFLFLGFSFTDPNIDYILSRVRVLYEQHQRRHYCVLRRVAKISDESASEFEYRKLKQDYFIRDLKRFGIFTVLVDEHSQLTALLEKLEANFKRSSIFISGAAETYGSWTKAQAESFLHKLSHQLVSRRNRIITGFGGGVGSAVINGALSYLNDSGKTISDEDIMMRPFPQVETGITSLADEWTAYRKAMIAHAGIVLFVFGNKLDAKGGLVPSDGMREEFDLCVRTGVHPLPIGATGFMAETLWTEVWGDFAKFFPAANDDFRQDFEKLGDSSKPSTELLAIIENLIQQLQRR